MIVVPVNLLIVTLFRKAKLKTTGMIPKKDKHIAKQKFWRKVQSVQSIDLDLSEGTFYDGVNMEKKSDNL